MDKKSKARKGRKGMKATTLNTNLTKVDAQFYELDLKNLRRNLATARNYIKTLEDENLKLKATCANQEMLTSAAAGILQMPANANVELSEMKNSINQLNDLHKKQILEYTEHIKDMENKYKAMQTQLISEVKILTGQLNILKEHRNDRSDIIKKLDEIEQNANQKIQQLKDQLNTTEATMLIDKHRIKGEVMDNLSKLYGDLTNYTQLQQVSYVKQLLRNNVALSRELHQQMESTFAANKMCRNIKLETQKIIEDNEYLNNLKVSLISNCKNKLHIIESLVNSYKRLRLEYLEAAKYRQLYEKLKNCKGDADKDQKELQESYIRLRKTTAHLQTENNEIKEINKNFENQIQKLTTTLNKIRKAVSEHISIQQLGDSSPRHNFSRQNLIWILEDILCGYKSIEENYPIVTETRSLLDVYVPGMIGLMQMRQKQPSFMNLLKSPSDNILRKNNRYSSAKMDNIQRSKQGELIIPEERQVGNSVLLDFEIGSTLHVTSSLTANVAEISEQEDTETEKEDDEDSIEIIENATSHKLTDAEADDATTNDLASIELLMKQ